MRDSGRFNRSAKLLLTGVFLLNLTSLGLLIFRFTLPTDGWLAAEPDSLGESGLVYQINVLGLPSDLQPGDWVTAVNHIPIENTITTRSTPLSAWQADSAVQYTVQRAAQTLTIDVTLTRWSFGRLLTAVFPDLSAIFSFLGTAVFSIVSYYTFWRRPDNAAAQALLFLAASLFSLVLQLDVLPQMLPDFINPVANLSLGILITAMFTVLLPPAFIRFGLAFPRPKQILARRPWLAYLPYLVGGLVVIAFIMRVYVAGWLWTGTAVLITILLLSHNAITMRDSISRGQMRWALGGVIVGLGLFSLTYVNVFFVESSQSEMGQLLSALSSLGFTVMGIGLAVAVLRYHLFDIERIINRVLVYGSLTLSIVLIYVLVVGYLSFLFQTETSLIISLIATGMAAVFFGHLQSWLQRGVNRLMYGQRDEPYRVLTRLGQQMQSVLEPAAALELTVTTIAHSLKLPYAAIRLLADGRLQTAAEFGRNQTQLTTFPLVYAGETIGDLAAASRQSHEPLTPGDLRLLNDLARQISPAAQAARLAQELEQARLRIVTAREETRRQLGSDLHDSVGHQLTGLVRQVEQASRLLSANPAALPALLDAINNQLDKAIADVRQLAHQLHPPELELLGLVGSLRERIGTARSFAVCLDAPDSLPALPAAVETAVYYITLEALTNIEKHAQAHSVKIYLRLSEDRATPGGQTLHLTIEDDGQGLAAQDNRGLGHLSMQARAAEVGGTCVIEPSESGGALVGVHLPLSFQME